MKMADLEEGFLKNISLNLAHYVRKIKNKRMNIFLTKDGGDNELFPKLGNNSIVDLDTLDRNKTYFWDHEEKYHDDVSSGRIVFNRNKQWYYLDINELENSFHASDIFDIQHQIFKFINNNRA